MFEAIKLSYFEISFIIMLRAQSTDAIHVNVIGAIEGFIHECTI